MDIDIADAESAQRELIDEQQDFAVQRDRRLRQLLQQSDGTAALSEIAERDLAKNERVHADGDLGQKVDQTGVTIPEMVDPNGRVHKDHRR